MPHFVLNEAFLLSLYLKKFLELPIKYQKTD